MSPYDYLGQLVSSKNTGINSSSSAEALEEYTYTYDNGGNITGKTYTDNNGDTTNKSYTASYTYDSNLTDLLTTYSKTASDGTLTTQTYDYTAENGSLFVNPTTITKSTGGTVTDTLSLSWKQGRQLSSIQSSAGTTLYEYNENGLRTYKKQADGTTHHYYYNGTQLEYIKILNASGTLTSTLRYIYNSSGQAEYIMHITSGNAKKPKAYDLYFILRDNTGIIQKLIKVRAASGSSVTNTYEIATVYSYDPYGKLMSTTKVNGDAVGTYNPLIYKDYIYDSETKWYYLQSRYYDPEIGRFLNGDSLISGVGQSVEGYNMFAYCMNDPINMSDSSGMWPTWSELANSLKKKRQAINEFVKSLIKTSFGEENVILELGFVRIKHADTIEQSNESSNAVRGYVDPVKGDVGVEAKYKNFSYSVSVGKSGVPANEGSIPIGDVTYTIGSYQNLRAIGISLSAGNENFKDTYTLEIDKCNFAILILGSQYVKNFSHKPIPIKPQGVPVWYTN